MERQYKVVESSHTHVNLYKTRTLIVTAKHVLFRGDFLECCKFCAKYFVSNNQATIHIEEI